MNETFTIAHLSDLHLTSPNDIKIRELLNKRIYGYIKWKLRRGAEHRGHVLEALIRDLQITEPDHIAVTGDLTHLGLPEEFRKAAELLPSLGPPSKVTVIPGNHDIYVSTDWNSTFGLWTNYMISDQAHLRDQAGTNSGSTFPSLRIRGLAALIGVCTARPSAPLLAVGSIGQAQLQELEKTLFETGRQRLFRIVLVHHPPVYGTVSWRKRLTDGSAFRSVLAQYGAELILHGHAHRSSLRQFETPTGWAPAVGVPSASSLGLKPWRRARYHLYRVQRTGNVWKVAMSVRGYSPEQESFAHETEKNLTISQPLHEKSGSSAQPPQGDPQD